MRLLKYFFLGFISGLVLFFPVMFFMYPFLKALLASSIIGFVYSLFVVGFMVRQLKEVVFEINAQNKDPEKGLRWYEEQILEQILDMRYREYLNVDGLRKFRPTGLYLVLESKIELRVTPYAISVKSSRMMCRILGDLVEINFFDLE